MVQGNRIGTDATGTVPLPNGTGVGIAGSANTVGGTAAEARNLISGNGTGVFSYFSQDTRVQGNYVGTDATGTRAVANGTGVSIQYATFVTVGGVTAACPFPAPGAATPPPARHPP